MLETAVDKNDYISSSIAQVKTNIDLITLFKIIYDLINLLHYSNFI